MKIGRFSPFDGVIATGVLVDIDSSERVLDLSRAANAFGDPAAGALHSLVVGGADVLERAYALIERGKKEGEAGWFSKLSGARWQVPYVPPSLLCAGRNFGRHAAEAESSWADRGASDAAGQQDIPTGFVKVRSSIVGDGAKVKRPDGLDTLDYEVEITAILGQPAHHVSEVRALDAVFGYTMLNDLSARAWQFQEMKNRMILVGKNFPGAGPLGPWILTADEVDDPQLFDLSLTVNGETRQDSDCADMIFSFAEMIAFWSKMGLDAGDAIASGTPEGVAHAHKPDPQEWFLKPGDVVVATSRRIGSLTTHIV
jgi:2-keto-4-pentenoate hydratase/2-oxohepta-3-ene-1,7-dioic acid hydratase in catechol pathway